MTATQTQLRRGTSAQCNSMTPAIGELVVDTSNKRPRLGDGSTAGGIIIPNAFDLQQQSFGFAVAGGTADVITVTLGLAPPSYSQPLTVFFKATGTNTGATTLNINGLGAKNIYKLAAGSLTALSAGDIISGVLYMAIYDGTQFQLYGLTSAGITSVSQGDINSSTGTFSATATVQANSGIFLSSSKVDLPGGPYGFVVETKRGSTGDKTGWIFGTDSNASYTSSVYSWGNVTTTNAVLGQQRYINSSPPFDMGDGDAGGFVFVQVNGSGEVVQHYAADVPPWGYNGPTNIRCDHQCPVTKKKFRNSMKKLTPQDVMNGAEIEYEMQEITQEIKNADMGLIPHPFTELPGHKIIMLDPMSDKVQRLIEIQNKGDSEIIAEMIYKGHLRVDSDKVSRKGPKGVNIRAAKYKS